MSKLIYLPLILMATGCVLNRTEVTSTDCELVSTVVKCLLNNDAVGIVKLMELDDQKDVDLTRKAIENSMPDKASAGKWSITRKEIVPMPADMMEKILSAGKEKGISLSDTPSHLLMVGYGGSGFAGQTRFYLKKVGDTYRLIGYQYRKH